ncbi:MAG: hypothetical protein ACE5H6_04035 [Dehalococcoidia bacterium]
MSKEKGGTIITIILTAIALAMGVAAAVLTVIEAGSTQDVLLLLGIGLFAISIALLNHIT